MLGSRGDGSFCRGGDLFAWCIILGGIGGFVVWLVSNLSHHSPMTAPATGSLAPFGPSLARWSVVTDGDVDEIAKSVCAEHASLEFDRVEVGKWPGRVGPLIIFRHRFCKFELCLVPGGTFMMGQVSAIARHSSASDRAPFDY